jgi:hypothetical protein
MDKMDKVDNMAIEIYILFFHLDFYRNGGRLAG